VLGGWVVGDGFWWAGDVVVGWVGCVVVVLIYTYIYIYIHPNTCMVISSTTLRKFSNLTF
jgi:hypothetical protein